MTVPCCRAREDLLASACNWQGVDGERRREWGALLVKNMKGGWAMEDEVALLKALAEPTRLRLAVLLAVNGETCVCRLSEAIEAPEFRVSRHLAIMRAHGLVKVRRQGTWMHYRLASPRSALERCLQACLGDCLAEQPTIKADLARLGKGTCTSRGRHAARMP